MIEVKIIKDSIFEGSRLTTFELIFPRIILAEFNTHRKFSRNSASSRAIPFEKMVESIKNNPFIPHYWPKSHKGMSAGEYYWDKLTVKKLEDIWLFGRDQAIETAKMMATGSRFLYLNEKNQSPIYHKLGGFSISKQICNRLLEPYMNHKVLMTSDEEGLRNFFELRCPRYKVNKDKEGCYFSKKDYCKSAKRSQIPLSLKDWMEINEGQSEPHMMELAEKMWDTYNESGPQELKEGGYHIPYSDLIPDNYSQEAKIKISVARAARTSYTEVGSSSNIGNVTVIDIATITNDNLNKDIKLYDKLLTFSHWSPFEHIAQAKKGNWYNFKDWQNLRYQLANGN